MAGSEAGEGGHKRDGLDISDLAVTMRLTCMMRKLQKGNAAYG